MKPAFSRRAGSCPKALYHEEGKVSPDSIRVVSQIQAVDLGTLARSGDTVRRAGRVRWLLVHVVAVTAVRVPKKEGGRKQTGLEETHGRGRSSRSNRLRRGATGGLVRTGTAR